jgi:NitT/TauT family transport system substrate-binding protein
MNLPTTIPIPARTLALGAALVLGSTALAACGDQADAAGSGDASVTVGVSGNIFDMPLRVAEDQGYFKAQGITVKFVTLTAATAPASLNSGSVQFLNESPTGFISSVQKKLPHIAIAANGLGNPLGIVVSTKFAQAKNLTADTPPAQVAAALAGSKGGTSSANTQAEAEIFLRANGVQDKQVNWVSLPSPAADQAALKNGQIDWFITSEPLPLQVENSGDGVVVADPLTVPQWSAEQAGYSQFVVVSKSYAKKNAGTVGKFAQAVQQATKYMNQNPDDAGVLKAATEALPGVPEQVLKDSIKLVDWPVSDAMDDANWKKTIDFVNDLATMDETASISKDDWTNEYLS